MSKKDLSTHPSLVHLEDGVADLDAGVVALGVLHHGADAVVLEHGQAQRGVLEHADVRLPRADLVLPRRRGREAPPRLAHF
jgi:hypothetical protein